MIGDRLRTARTSQQLSLSDVATKAQMSVATLSRIETNKQGLDFEVFLTLARILHTAPNEFLEQKDDLDERHPMVRKLSTLRGAEKVRFWRDLSAANRIRRAGRKSLSGDNATEQQLEELLAQVEYLREEIDALRISHRRR